MSEPEGPSDPSAPDDTSSGDKEEAHAAGPRKAPPPLPAFAAQPTPAAPSEEAPVAKRGAGKTIAYGALILALLVLAAAAGLGFGDLVQRKPPASITIVTPPEPVPTAAPSTAPPAAPAATVTLPAVEIK